MSEWSSLQNCPTRLPLYKQVRKMEFKMSNTNIVRTGLLAVFTFLTLLACGQTDHANAIPAVTQTQFQGPTEGLRNYRYCEILPIFQSGLTLHIEVYATIGLNDCPDEAWQALNADDMADEYGAVQVTKNGPRFWLMDGLAGGGDSVGGKVADFGGIEMALRAVLERQLSEGNVGEAFYVENEVQRTTTFTYRAGRMVYELTSPEGDVYRMQSYTHIVDPTLTIDDLETLGDRLELPEGWAYEARVLNENSELIVDGLAFVINDNFLNAYQKVTASE